MKLIAAYDHTRPVPSRIIMPLMLEEIRKGNPEARVRILIATGCHRGTSKAELVDKFGNEIVESFHMKWASSIKEAMDMAERILNKNDSSITVIPDGVSVIIV